VHCFGKEVGLLEPDNPLSESNIQSLGHDGNQAFLLAPLSLLFLLFNNFLHHLIVIALTRSLTLKLEDLALTLFFGSLCAQTSCLRLFV
jgi:hypothetical protein